MSTAEIITLIIGIFTFLGVLLSIFNLNALKYIETITNQKIKNLDAIRNEVAMIIANIHIVFVKSKNNIEGLKSENGKEEEDAFPIDNIDIFVASFSQVFYGKEQYFSYSDMITHLNLLKLRIDLVGDNKKMIDIIDYFISFFVENKDVGLGQIQQAEIKYNEFVNLAQELIKNEWKKAEMEAKRNIFSVIFEFLKTV